MAFLAAVQFLTIAPAVIRRPFTAAEMGRAVGFFPLVGLLLGGLLAGVQSVLVQAWPPGVAAVILLAAWVILTGGLHLDGFLDSLDGLFGGRDPEQRLRIMQDERVGAYAVIGAVLLLLLKATALGVMDKPIATCLLAPMLGRWSVVLAIVFFPYGRTEGLGRAMKDNAGWREVVIATAVTWPACWLAALEVGLAAMAVAAAAVGLIALFVLRRLPGLTGDIYGACCEIVEVLVLLVLTVEF